MLFCRPAPHTGQAQKSCPKQQHGRGLGNDVDLQRGVFPVVVYAVAIADLLDSRGIRLDHVLDEGGAIADGLVPGVDGTVALVGVAEKGFASVELLVEMTGGHSSMPPAQSAGRA